MLVIVIAITTGNASYARGRIKQIGTVRCRRCGSIGRLTSVGVYLQQHRLVCANCGSENWERVHSQPESRPAPVPKRKPESRPEEQPEEQGQPIWVQCPECGDSITGVTLHDLYTRVRCDHCMTIFRRKRGGGCHIMSKPPPRLHRESRPPLRHEKAFEVECPECGYMIPGVTPLDLHTRVQCDQCTAIFRQGRDGEWDFLSLP
jgi:hypothetical protein